MSELLVQVEQELFAAERRIEDLLDEREALLTRVAELEALQARAEKCHSGASEHMNGRQVARYILEGI